MSYILAEIAGNSIKLAVLRKKKGKIFFDAPQSLYIQGFVKNDPEALKKAAETIKFYKSRNGIRTRKVVSLIHSGETVAKLIRLDNVPQAELAAAVENNMESYFPIDRSVYASDYKIIAEGTVLLAALPEALLWDYVNFFSSAGLSLVRNETVAALVSDIDVPLKTYALLWRETGAVFICYFDAGRMQSLRRIPAQEVIDALPELHRLENYYALQSSLERAVFIYEEMKEISKYLIELGVETEVIRDEYTLLRLILPREVEA